MSYKAKIQQSQFELESLEPRIMLAADAGAGAVATAVISETISAAELDEINQRSDDLNYKPDTSSIFDFEENKDESEESTKEITSVSVTSDTTSESSRVETDSNFVFRAQADENDLLLRVNPDDLKRIELLDQASGEVLLEQDLSEVESVSIFGSD